MLDKHSSAGSLAFVYSEMSIRNFRTLKLLSKHLEEKYFWKIGLGLTMLACEPFSEQTKRVVNSKKKAV